MSDRLDSRIRAFVVELVDDPPQAPPFPHSEVVVIRGDRSHRRRAMETMSPKTEQRTPWWRGPRVALGVVATTAVVVLAVVAVVSLTGSNDSDVAEARSATIHAYLEAYNAGPGNIDGIMAFFTEQSVITGHPLSASDVTGIAPIKNLHQMDLSLAAEVDPYIISNVEVSGNTVTWDHVWTSVIFGDQCVEGNIAIVEDGKILSWAFAAESGTLDTTCP